MRRPASRYLGLLHPAENQNLLLASAPRHAQHPSQHAQENHSGHCCMSSLHLPVEDREHLFFSCVASRAVWHKIGINPSFGQFTDLWSSPLPAGLPSDVWPSIALVVCWTIWDARNAKVFRAIDQPTSITVGKIVSDLAPWMNRCKRPVQKEYADLWRSFLSSRRA